MDRRAVSATALVIGPGAVSGPHPVPAELIGAAIDAIDDAYMLVDERPVSVDEVWARVIAESAGDPDGRLLLVCPGWWSEARVNRIRHAAQGHCDRPVMLWRHEVLSEDDGSPGSVVACIVEIAPEFVICRFPGSPITVTPRLGSTLDVAGIVTHGIIGVGPVLIDAPVGVAGAAALAAALTEQLHGREVRVVDDATVAAALQERHPPVARRRRTTVGAVSAGLLLALGLPLGMARTGEPAEHPVTLLTEGRVALEIPAGWVVRRITDGTGSPRVQAFPPGEQTAAVLLTQSVAGPDLARTAEVLEAALALQPPGIFSGLRTGDHRGGRAVLGYLETRADREISWAVFLDGPVRIAIGCQQSASAPAIRHHCDEAIRSAHATR